MKNASYCVSYGKERRLQQNELKSSFCYSPLFEYQVCSFSLQQMVKKLKPAYTNYKLRTTNYKVKGT